MVGYLGVKHAKGCASGIDALLLPMLTLGLKPGNEVIVPGFTFFATAEAVSLLGATPVFVDVLPDTLNLDPRRIESRITPRARGLIAVSLFGQCAVFEELSDVARRHKLLLVEHAAQRCLYWSKDGLVIDLAVRDLELVYHLFGPLEHVLAHRIQTDSHRQGIYARVMLKTRSGVLVSSEFSWISPRKQSSLSIYGDKGLLVGNPADQEVWFYENGDVGIDYSDSYCQKVIWGRVSEGKVVKFPIKREEPLHRELEYFCRLAQGEIRDHDLLYGKLAVEYSQAVPDSGRSGQVPFDEERSSR